MSTIAQMETKFDIKVLEHLDREVSVPVVTTVAAQGDVLIHRVTKAPATTVVPAAGYPVVRGENGGNTHSLHGDGPVFFDAAPAREDGSLVLGRLTVPEGSEAVMAHPEHGFIAIAPGTYEIGRQREYAGEWRLVAD